MIRQIELQRDCKYDHMVPLFDLLEFHSLKISESKSLNWNCFITFFKANFVL